MESPTHSYDILSHARHSVTLETITPTPCVTLPPFHPNVYSVSVVASYPYAIMSDQMLGRRQRLCIGPSCSLTNRSTKRRADGRAPDEKCLTTVLRVLRNLTG